MSLLAIFAALSIGIVLMGLISVTSTKSITIAGLPFAESYTLTANQNIGGKITTNAAWSATLTTRTDNTDGTLTVQAGHNISTGNLLDIYWTNSDGSMGVRYGSTVGTVSGQTVPFTTGASGGQNLPVASTAVFACVPVNQPMAFTGNNVVAAAVASTVGPYCVNFLNSTTSEYAQYVNNGATWQWLFTQTVTTNPFAGFTITNVQVSTTSTSAQQVSVGVLSN